MPKGPFPFSLPQSAGRSIQVAASSDPEFVAIGGRIDWDLVAPADEDVEYPDGNKIEAGEKYLRYGQVMVRKDDDSGWGPYDPAAEDGRDVLARGHCFICNELIAENDVEKNGDFAFGPLVGGHAWRDRIIATSGAASLAAGPTWAALEAAFPRLTFAPSTDQGQS